MMRHFHFFLLWTQISGTRWAKGGEGWKKKQKKKETQGTQKMRNNNKEKSCTSEKHKWFCVVLRSDESPSEAEPAVRGGLADWLRMCLTAGLRFPSGGCWLLLLAFGRLGLFFLCWGKQSKDTALDKRRRWRKATGRSHRRPEGPLAREKVRILGWDNGGGGKTQRRKKEQKEVERSWIYPRWEGRREECQHLERLEGEGGEEGPTGRGSQQQQTPPPVLIWPSSHPPYLEMHGVRMTDYACRWRGVQGEGGGGGRRTIIRRGLVVTIFHTTQWTQKFCWILLNVWLTGETIEHWGSPWLDSSKRCAMQSFTLRWFSAGHLN